MLENEKMLKALQEMNMFSDVFFKEIVRNIECASYILKTIIPDANIKKSEVQKEISNPLGREIKADLLMEGIEGTKYNIEVRNEKSQFPSQRTRYHESLITCTTTPKRTDFFINGETDSESDIGVLIKDMKEKDPSRIKSEVIRKQAKHLKESEEGKRSMCAIMERFYNQGKNEGLNEGVIETLTDLLIQKFGNISNRLKAVISNSSLEKLNDLKMKIFIVEDEEDVIKILI